MKKTDMEQYLTEKLDYVQKILDITREQQTSFRQDKLDKTRIYLSEKAKLITGLKALDERFEKTANEWNSGKTRVTKESQDKINSLNDKIRSLLDETNKKQQEQMTHFTEERDRLREELLKLRQDQKAAGIYQDPHKSARILDIKR